MVARYFGRATWTIAGINWYSIIVAGFFALVFVLASVNLAYNPHPWPDEGAALSVARTLAEDGVYASRSSEGYQSFGAVQSVGPTVLVPVALSYQLFGVGLVQGRLVAVIFLMIAVALFHGVGVTLFGRRAALLADALLLGAPAVRLLHFGRQVVGEVPALAFFLAGWLIWSVGLRSGRFRYYPLAGALIGAAMVTKSQYILVGFGTLAALVLLDLVFYRQGQTRAFIVLGLVAGACVAAWWGWQVTYYGLATFQGDSAKLRELADATMGFRPRLTQQAITWLFGPGSGFFYFFWGGPALVYAACLSLRRKQEGLILAFGLVFAVLWLIYWTAWIIPWPQYALAPTAIIALFVAKLGHDLTDGCRVSLRLLRAELRSGSPGRGVLAGVMALLLAGMLLYSWQIVLRADVLDSANHSTQDVAAYLTQNVSQQAVVETWDRELAVFTNHRYHFPDNELLAPIHAAEFHGGSTDYALGADYFRRYQPAYLVIGPVGRGQNVYSSTFLASNAQLLVTIDDDYQVYRLLPVTAGASGPQPAGEPH
jgi:4-amino-4-deoxy-L-arabinose transferase-like glycosyltransferase